MKRHPFNVFSLGFGVVLILLAVGLVVPTEFSYIATLRWLVPLALVLVGISMLGSVLRRRETDTDPGKAEAMDGELDESEPEAATGTEEAASEPEEAATESESV